MARRIQPPWSPPPCPGHNKRSSLLLPPLTPTHGLVPEQVRHPLPLHPAQGREGLGQPLLPQGRLELLLEADGVDRGFLPLQQKGELRLLPHGDVEYVQHASHPKACQREGEAEGDGWISGG